MKAMGAFQIGKSVVWLWLSSLTPLGPFAGKLELIAMIKEYKSRTFDEDINAVDSHQGKWTDLSLRPGSQLALAPLIVSASCRCRKHQ